MFALDYNKGLYHKYHLTNKLLLPSLILNYTTYKIKPEYSYIPSLLNVYLFSYHSCFSTATIITDYVKPKLLKNICRGGNISLHFVAVGGFTYNIIKSKFEN